jgi:hypothetical protein
VGCAAGGVEEGDEVVDFFFWEGLEVEASVFELCDEGEGFEEFQVFGSGLFFFGLRWFSLGSGRSGLFGLGVGGDAGDVEDGGGGAAGDFGFFAGVHEVDQPFEGEGDVADGEELELQGGEVGFEF